MIVLRIAVCLPRDESLDDIGVDSRGTEVPGGRWLVEPLVSRLVRHGAEITFIDADPAQYWWIEMRYRRARLMLTVGHVFPYECVVTLLTRRGLADRVLRRDYLSEAESLFSVICDALRADSRAGEIVTWKGPSNVRSEQQFLADARSTLRRDGPLPGSMRVSRSPQ